MSIMHISESQTPVNYNTFKQDFPAPIPLQGKEKVHTQ